jgi:integrase
MKTLQKWMGHSNYKTTESIYTHITTEFEIEEIKRFSDYISGQKRA